MNRDDCVELQIDIPVTRSTEKAILVHYEGESFWIPQSHIHEDSEVYKVGDEGTLVVSRWIAEKKGLI